MSPSAGSSPRSTSRFTVGFVSTSHELGVCSGVSAKSGRVDVNPPRRHTETRLHGPTGLVAPVRGEQVNLGVAPAELREGDAAAPAGEEARVAQVDDVARRRHALGASQRHVLHVAHDGDARRAHGAASTSATGTMPVLPRAGWVSTALASSGDVRAQRAAGEAADEQRRDHHARLPRRHPAALQVGEPAGPRLDVALEDAVARHDRGDQELREERRVSSAPITTRCPCSAPDGLDHVVGRVVADERQEIRCRPPAPGARTASRSIGSPARERVTSASLLVNARS